MTLASQIFDLTNWKWTSPLGVEDSPTEIKQPALLTYDNAPYLTVVGGGIQFRAPIEGATTSGSNYPRSELREMNGVLGASWDTINGAHIMRVRLAVTHLPVVKPQIVCSQIHDASDDVIEIRCELISGSNVLKVDHNGVNLGTLDASYILGTPFDMVIDVRGGHIKTSYNGVLKSNYAVNAIACYFKTGVYTQSNLVQGDSAGAYGEVIVYNCKVEHSVFGKPVLSPMRTSIRRRKRAA